MNKSISRLTLAGLLIAAVVLAPVAGLAQDKKTNNASGSKAQEKSAHNGQRAIPFRGKITAIDKSAMTLTLGKRVFHITSETKITKHDQPATLADGVVGEAVTGNYLKDAAGKLNAKTVHLDPKPAKKKKAAKKEKAEATDKQ